MALVRRLLHFVYKTVDNKRWIATRIMITAIDPRSTIPAKAVTTLTRRRGEPTVSPWSSVDRLSDMKMVIKNKTHVYTNNG